MKSHPEFFESTRFEEVCELHDFGERRVLEPGPLDQTLAECKVGVGQVGEGLQQDDGRDVRLEA